MTTRISLLIEEIYLHSTPDGWEYSMLGQEEEAICDLRVEIDAESRDEWDVVEIKTAMTVRKNGSGSKLKEFNVPLEGNHFEAARAFLIARFQSDLQEKVDENVLPNGDDAYPHLRAQDVVNTGRKGV